MTAAIIHQSLTLVHIIFNIGNKKNTKKGLLINYFCLLHEILTTKIISNCFNDNIDISWRCIQFIEFFLNEFKINVEGHNTFLILFIRVYSIRVRS